MNRNQLSNNMAWVVGFCAVMLLLIVATISDTVAGAKASSPAPVFVCKGGQRYLITQDGAWPQIDDSNRIIHCGEEPMP